MFNYEQTLSHKVHTLCVNIKIFLAISIHSHNCLSNYGQTSLRKVHTWCVNLKIFLAMSIHSLCGGFTKTQRRCHKKNDMVQSHHFIEITITIGKVLKKNLDYSQHSFATFVTLVMKIVML